jgi:polyphenol oxidase
MSLIRPVILRPSIFPESRIVAGFTTRHGGDSEPPFDSLNLGMSTGDDRSTVARNRVAAFESLGFEIDDVAFAGQIHGSHVRVVTKAGLYTGTDGLVTCTPGLLLAITAADCAAILLADMDAGVVGACHAGWRGAVGGIVEETLRVMESEGASLAQIRAYVSPCIGAESFEVGPEVASEFAPDFIRKTDDSDRSYVDLKADIGHRLLSAGISEDAIEVSPHCTVRAVGDFFSHRAESGRTGRMMGIIGIR